MTQHHFEVAERAKFERWAERKGLNVDRAGGSGYRMAVTQFAWLAWAESAKQHATAIERAG